MYYLDEKGNRVYTLKVRTRQHTDDEQKEERGNTHNTKTLSALLKFLQAVFATAFCAAMRDDEHSLLFQ